MPTIRDCSKLSLVTIWAVPNWAKKRGCSAPSNERFSEDTATAVKTTRFRNQFLLRYEVAQFAMSLRDYRRNKSLDFFSLLYTSHKVKNYVKFVKNIALFKKMGYN